MFRTILKRFAGPALAAIAAFGSTHMPAMAQSAPLEKLVVQLATPTPDSSFMTLYAGSALGYFKQEGLEIELRYGAGAPLAFQLAASGGADIAGMTYEPAIIGYQKGVRGKLIYQSVNDLIYSVAVPEGSPIKTAAELTGKKIGVLGLGTASVFVARSMLLAEKIPVEQDTFVPVGLGNQAAAALNTQQVDALYLWSNQYAAMEKAGTKLRYFPHPTLANVGSGGFFVSDETLATRRDALARFTRAVARATAFMLARPQDALRIWWQVNPNARGQQSEAEAQASGLLELQRGALASFDISHKADKRFGAIDKEAFARYMQAFEQTGAIAQVPPIDDIVTDEFIDFANDFDRGEAENATLSLEK